jgi:hypothetical protein
VGLEVRVRVRELGFYSGDSNHSVSETVYDSLLIKVYSLLQLQRLTTAYFSLSAVNLLQCIKTYDNSTVWLCSA